jgi:hypothetical protein
MAAGLDRSDLRQVRLVVLLFVLFLAATALDGAAARATAPFELVVVVHGHGRVDSVPPGSIGCPTTCDAIYPAAGDVTLHSTPDPGYAVFERIGCVGPSDSPDCTATVNGFGATVVDISFRPAAELQLLPEGHGSITVTPAGTDPGGEEQASGCADLDGIQVRSCYLYFLPDTVVTATATPEPGSTFLGWSRFDCPGTGACTLTLHDLKSALTARFSPLPINVIVGGDGTGRVVSDPVAVDCPDRCLRNDFPVGTTVTLKAVPDPASPFVRWVFGCTPSPTDPLSCTVTVSNYPEWVGVDLGADESLAPPTRVSVLFDVTRAGSGSVKGNHIDCGDTCARTYSFGDAETLTADAASGWRFVTWRGACGQQSSCTLNVGPVTTIQAVFAENLAPRVVAIRSTGLRQTRRISIRLHVAHTATATIALRRLGTGRTVYSHAYPISSGASTVVVRVPRAAKPGPYRLTIDVRDASGDGKRFVRTERLGP